MQTRTRIKSCHYALVCSQLGCSNLLFLIVVLGDMGTTVRRMDTQLHVSSQPGNSLGDLGTVAVSQPSLPQWTVVGILCMWVGQWFQTWHPPNVH